MSDRIPRANRPMKRLYMAIALLLKDDRYLEITEQEYIDFVMSEVSGSVDPEVVAQSYRYLIKEAGLEPL